MSQVDNRKKSNSKGSTSTTGRHSNTENSRNRSSRSRSSYQPRRSTKRRRNSQYDITKILIGIIITVVLVSGIAVTAKFIGKGSKASLVETTTADETKLQKEVTVDGISITGMSREQAKETIMKEYAWGMKVSYKDQEQELKNLMEKKIDALMEEIYKGASKDTYTLDTSGLEEAIQEEVKIIAKKWDVPAKNGSISSFDAASGTFVYAGEQKGIVIDQKQLIADIQKELAGKNFTAVLKAVGQEQIPEITEAQAKDMYQVIGTYSTTTTANSDRNKNIELASNSMNGLILQPGDEFSFNKTTGERSEARGYRPAGAYLNGELVEEPGGGVCQVSSTLYNAVVFSGLTTTERHAHSYEPSYVTPGEDAMVSFGGPDMKFVNSSSTAIAIRASFADRKLKISIVGIPILKDGVTLSMTSQKTAELDAPAPLYEEDQTLASGVENIVKKEKKGSRWVTNLVTKKDGVVVSDEFFHNSTYRGKPATIKRNTSGVVIPAATETAVSTSAVGQTESIAASESQTTAPTASTASTSPGLSADKPTTAPPQTSTQQEGPGSQPGTTGAEKESINNIVPPNPLG